MKTIRQPEGVESWPLDRILPFTRNPKIHGAEQVDRIAASMERFGWTVPCLVAADGELIAGHGRLLAARRLGLTEAPVIVLPELTEAERRAYRIADNKLTEMGEWDEDVLRSEVELLLAEEFDLGLLGMPDDELAVLMGDGTEGEGEGAGPGGAGGDEEETPEPPADPLSELGDVWIMGDHRLICGDCTAAEVIEALLAGEKPHLMVTDPPYGVEYDPNWRNEAGAATTKRTGVVLNDDRADWRETWALVNCDVAYVWHGALHAPTVAESLEAVGYEIRGQIIWAKERFALSRGAYHWQHEPAWYAVRKGAKDHWQPEARGDTLWQISARDQDADTIHGTQKPVECMRRPMIHSSAAGDSVFEPFMGSGTTLIAAQTIGRRCFGVELNPAYVDVAVQRWQKLTGEDAILERSGETYDALLAARDALVEPQEQKPAEEPKPAPKRGRRQAGAKDAAKK